jgi:hypothetical protein
MGEDRGGPTVREMTPREILDAVDRALDETSGRLAAQKPRDIPRLPEGGNAAPRGRPMTPREILEAIDNALEETSRRFANNER